MCEFCVLEDETLYCDCPCSTYKGKKYCEKCGHKIRVYQMPR